MHNIPVVGFFSRFGDLCIPMMHKSALVAVAPIERDVVHPCEAQSPNSIRNAVEWEKVHP